MFNQWVAFVTEDNLANVYEFDINLPIGFTTWTITAAGASPIILLRGVQTIDGVKSKFGFRVIYKAVSPNTTILYNNQVSGCNLILIGM